MERNYTGTPLAKKLGYKPGFLARLIQAPEHYFDLLLELPEGVHFTDDAEPKKDLIHVFTKDFTEFSSIMSEIRNEIKQTGMFWISWPKKASGIPCDITGDNIRSWARNNGLIDAKVCSVDEVWSGYKLVIPVKDRIK